jgi:hypothetical protein
MATEHESAIGEALDRELAGLLDVETFDPPAEFRERALLSDPAVYEQAARDPQAWWVEQAERLDWFQKWDTVLDDSNPPFYKWFVGGSSTSRTTSWIATSPPVAANVSPTTMRGHPTTGNATFRKLMTLSSRLGPRRDHFAGKAIITSIAT